MNPEKKKYLIDIYSAKIHQNLGPTPKSEKKKGGKKSDLEEAALSEVVIYQKEVAEFKPTEELGETVSKPPKKRFKFSWKPGRLFYVGLAVLAVCFALTFWYLLTNVWARAEIQITTKKENLEFNENIAFDKSSGQVDATKKVVPAQLLSFKETKSAEFEPTGPLAGGTKAKGKIKIYNNYGPNPQILVATTRFVSPDGKIFRLDNRVVVPAATLKDGNLEPSFVEATVTADQIGEEYNIGPTKFTIPGFQGTPKYEKFYAISEEAMTGGGSGKFKTVTADDLKNAQKIVSDQVFSAFNNDLQEKANSGLKFLEAAKEIKITTIESNAKIGEAVSKFKVTVAGEMNALGFDEKQVMDLINKAMQDEIPPGAKIAYFQIEYNNARVDFQKGQMVVSSRAQLTLAPPLESAELLNQIKGQDINEVRTLLSQKTEISQAKVKLWPSWLNRLPRRPDKIKILVD